MTKDEGNDRPVETLALTPKRQQGISPPGDGRAPHQPPTVPAADQPKAQKEGRDCPGPQIPKARPAPTATKIGPPQPPDVFAATSKAKPAPAKASGGPEEAIPKLAAEQPPQSEHASEYNSYSESQSSETMPPEKQAQGEQQRAPQEGEQPPPLPPLPKARVSPDPPPRGHRKGAARLEPSQSAAGTGQKSGKGT